MGFFKAYDMRGTFGVDFDLETVHKVGMALPQVVGGKRWLVGRDMRTTSVDVRGALVQGLTESEVSVTDMGLCTTPMVYFFTAQDDFDGSVMVTASHNPPTDNGMKVSKKTALPVGYADGLKDVERLVKSSDPGEWRVESGVTRVDYLPRYVAWMKERLPDVSNLKFAIDCSNGMSSILVKELFPTAEVINDTLDGTFPAHSPNPLKAEAREQLAQLVREKGLDCGVIFDGDADRAMFVDETGAFIQPDYLIPVVARATLGHNNTVIASREAAWQSNRPKIIHDVRTSRGAIEALREMGCEPVMVPVGHAFAKPILRERGAVCGGELAGHYYFSEFFGCDSGVLAAIRILGEVARAKAAGQTFSQMMAPITSRYANSGELNFRVEDKEAAIARVLAVAAEKLPPEVSRSNLDGVRIEYADGWINIRQSNTEPYLRLIAECKSAAQLAEWVQILTDAIQS